VDNVLRAAVEAGVSRTVLLSTISIFEWGETLTERSQVIPVSTGASPYTTAKRAAFYRGMLAASLGQDVLFVVPGGVYGPAPIGERALVPTSFSGSILSALRGELTKYLKMRFLWVFSEDVAKIALLALDRGVLGERYLAVGRPDEVMSLAD